MWKGTDSCRWTMSQRPSIRRSPYVDRIQKENESSLPEGVAVIWVRQWTRATSPLITTVGSRYTISTGPSNVSNHRWTPWGVPYGVWGPCCSGGASVNEVASGAQQPADEAENVARGLS